MIRVGACTLSLKNSMTKAVRAMHKQEASPVGAPLLHVWTVQLEL